MPPSISKRHYLRWLPDPVPDQDDTSTIVTTSSKNRFVDLRIFKESPSGETVLRVQPISQLEWGLAGTSSSTPKKGPKGEPISHGVWRHWIDSRTPDAEGVQDEGDNYPLPNNEVLELGSMTNPATGKITAYEEKWADVPLKPTTQDGKIQGVVLELHDDEHAARGLVVRAGQYCQGIVRVGEEVAVERWVWDEVETGASWKRRVRMGDLFLPCGVVTEEGGKLELGGKVRYGEQVWSVIELEEN